MALLALVLSIVLRLAVSSDGGDEILGCAGFAKVSQNMRQYLAKGGKDLGAPGPSKIDYSDVTVGLAINYLCNIVESKTCPNLAFLLLNRVSPALRYFFSIFTVFTFSGSAYDQGRRRRVREHVLSERLLLHPG